MALLKLDFQPGINKENTPYSTEGGWEDSDKIRFRSGRPEKIGGWEKSYAGQLIGAPRATHVFRALDGTIYTAIATHIKVYIGSGGTFDDVTPIRETQALTNPFDTTAGSAVITVNDTAHGADDGAYVTISGSADVDGIPAAEINTEHQITYVDADSYTITVTTTGSAGVTGGGGASVSAEYQINPGAADGAFQYGWGAGAWNKARASGAGWNRPAAAAGVPLDPTLWTFANWGEDLVMNRRGDAVWIWDATTPTARATQITQAPHQVNYVIVTQDRHMVCMGCDEPGGTGAIDKMLIRWCSQEDYTDWTPVYENTAGDQLLTGGTEIIAAAQLEGQTVIWTDETLHSMQYLGPPYTFGVQRIGAAVGLVGPNAWVAYNNSVYWMGQNGFYSYSSGVSPMPCTVNRFVFSNFNIKQGYKVFGSLNREFNEISWFYPTTAVEDTELNGAITAADTTLTVNTTAGFPASGSVQIGTEIIDYTGKTDATFTGCTRGARGTVAAVHNDEAVVSDPDGSEPLEPCRYVTIGAVDPYWWIGRLERTAWTDRGALQYPIATTRDGYIYDHEKGYDADGAPLAAFVESSDFDLGEGDQMMFIHRVLPDFTLEGSVDLKLRTRYYPLSDQVNETVGNVTNNTTKIDTRIRGRQMALRIESDENGDYWKYGSTRIDQRPDGRR